mgnify:FL=1
MIERTVLAAYSAIAGMSEACQEQDSQGVMDNYPVALSCLTDFVSWYQHAEPLVAIILPGDVLETEVLMPDDYMDAARKALAKRIARLAEMAT